MSIAFDPSMLMTMSCTIEHASMTGPPDEYGNPTREMTTTSSPCWLAQSSRGESPFNVVEQDKWNLYLPAGTEIDSNDRVHCDGFRFEVLGNPWHTFHPYFRSRWQVEVTLHRTE